jgi:hypothetical protein
MKKLITLTAVAAITLSFGATSASAQGPAGNGAGSAAAGNSSSSSHSYNPLHWVKKSKSTADDQLASNADRDKKLAANLQTAGVLAPNASLTETCAPFTALHDCLAALHASKNAAIEFNCLRANVTGVQTNADLSSCKGASDKRMDLHKAIHLLKPEVDAKAQSKNAEKQAQDDLKNAA